MQGVNDSMLSGMSQTTERKRSFYRRVSVHHFHVMKDQMACCCCVPLGMAYHIIACLDIIVGIISVVEALEYYTAANEETEVMIDPAKKAFYTYLFYTLSATTIFYSIPRIPTYLFTLRRQKSYARLKVYFRTRILTFLCLLFTMVVLFSIIFMNVGAMAQAYDSPDNWILLQVGAFMIVWLVVDLYYSI